MNISRMIRAFVEKRQLAIHLLQRYIGFHILVEFIPRMFFAKDLYQTEGISGIGSKEAFEQSFYGVPTHFVQDWAHIIILTVVLAGVFLLFIGPRFWIFGILLVGVEALSYLNNWILDGGDNWLKFLLLYSFAYRSSVELVGLFNRENWRRILAEIQALSGFNIAAHFALIYLISGVAKMGAEVWHEGVALYYILSAARFCSSEIFHDLMKNPILVVVGTYATILWEISMPFLVWFKPYKYYMIILAILFHASVFLIMMLGGFQLLFIATLLIYLEDVELIKLRGIIIKRIVVVARAARLGRISDAIAD